MRLGVFFLSITLMISVTQATDIGNIFLGSALDRMHERWLTNYKGWEEFEFRAQDSITRGEAAKFFAKFGEVIGLEEVKTDTECMFTDLEWYDHTLTPNILQACKYGLVNGFDGKYMPNGPLTEAEALTVIVRSIRGKQDETWNHWYGRYFELANWSLGLVRFETMETVGYEHVQRRKLWVWLTKIGMDVEEGILSPEIKDQDSDEQNSNIPFEEEWNEFVDDQSWDTQWFGNLILQSVSIRNKDGYYVLTLEVKNIWDKTFELDEYQPLGLRCVSGWSNKWFEAKMYSTPNFLENQHYNLTVKPNAKASFLMWLDEDWYSAIKKYFNTNMSCIINAPLPLEVTAEDALRFWVIFLGSENGQYYVHEESNYYDNLSESVLQNLVNGDFQYVWTVARDLGEPETIDESLADSSLEIEITSDTNKIYKPWDKVYFKVSAENLDSASLIYATCLGCWDSSGFDSSEITFINNTYNGIRTVPERWEGEKFVRIMAHWSLGQEGMWAGSEEWILVNTTNYISLD